MVVNPGLVNDEQFLSFRDEIDKVGIGFQRQFQKYLLRVLSLYNQNRFRGGSVRKGCFDMGRDIVGSDPDVFD